MATSASRITCSGADLAVASAIPIDAPMNSSRPSIRNGSLQAVQDALGDDGRLARVADVVEQERELVAAQPGDGVVRAERTFQAACDRLEQLVAAGVAEAVVDDLEAVEVEEQHRGAALAGWWRWARRIDWSRRSTNRTRLGRPVSASWSASCWSRRSASRRSVTSVIEPTIRIARPRSSRTAVARASIQR